MKTKLRGLIKTENIAAVIIFGYLLMIPSVETAYGLIQYTGILSMVLLSLSLTLVWGYTGIFSFCQAVFFGIGAYVYGTCYKFTENAGMTVIYALIAVLAAALFAAILGFFMFYGGINDVFVGLITLLISLIGYKFMQVAAGDGWQMHGRSGDFDLGGWTGMRGLAAIQFGENKLEADQYYILVFVLVLTAYLALRLICNTRKGHGIMAVRENRDRSALFGYNVPKMQTIVFAAGGAMAALAGILYVGNSKNMTLDKISVSASTMPLVIIATAGRKNPTSAVVFTVIYYLLDNFLASYGSQYSPIIMGLILVIVILVLPAGLFTSLFEGVDGLFARVCGSGKKADKEV